MYDIERTAYGYRVAFGGRMDVSELAAWRRDSKEALADSPSSFGVLVDMRELAPLTDDAQAEMIAGQLEYREEGMG